LSILSLTETVQPTEGLEGDAPAAASPRARADRGMLAEIAVERTRMPMVVTDPRQPDNPIVMANKAFLELTGYTAEEVLGRNCRLLQGVGTAPAAIAAIRQGVAAQRDTDVELLNYRKDGSAFWNQLSLSPVHDDAGKLLYFFGSQIDVTEFRKVQTLEASEHRLMKEVDHRARNVLAVVNGIVRLSRADDAVRYAEAIQQRVQALSEAHGLLADRGWQETSLESIVRQRLARVDASRCSLGGPAVMVSALVVQPLALVIHELVDNARLHGALSRPGGAVEVRWADAPAYGGFSLRWRERGGPEPLALRQPGFGAVMMTGMIERQLRGQFREDWDRSGLTVDISIPGSLEAVRAASA
jgi:PAS domain S-box-containing protein